MAVDGIDIWTPPVAKIRKNALSKHHIILVFSLSVDNEQADAEQDGRTCLARPNSQARTSTGTMMFS